VIDRGLLMRWMQTSIAIMGVLSGPLVAGASDLAAALTEEEVAITVTYSGAKVTLFGAAPTLMNQNGSLIVALRGPNEPVDVRKKRRTAGLWLNGPPMEFVSAPSYLAIASTRPLAEITNRTTLVAEGLDLATAAKPGPRDMVGDTLPAYRAALARLRLSQNLYQIDGGGVTVLQGGLFRADFKLPGSAPPGAYTAQILLLEDGKVTARTSGRLNLNRTGLERSLFDLAHTMPIVYGLIGALISIGFGWLSFILFRNRG
jgi:uncharacterized protein (TIGR02186 family)